MAKKQMDFEEVLASDHRHLVDEIEHGCSDVQVLHDLVAELERVSGYHYVLSERLLAGE